MNEEKDAPSGDEPKVENAGGASALEAGRKLIRYALDSVKTTGLHLRDIWHVLISLLKKRQFGRLVREAEGVVGEQLGRAGLGDAQLREQLDAVDQRIENLKSADASPKHLLTERRGILRRLFHNAEETASEPASVISARQALREIHEMREQNEDFSGAIRQRLVPSNGDGWRKLGLGYVIIFAISYLGARFILPSSSDPPYFAITGVSDRRIEDSVGLVVSGLRLTMPDGDVNEIFNSTGTCFAVTSDGYLLTNKHVTESYENLQRAEAFRERLRNEALIDASPKLWVFFAGEQFDAKVLHSDKNYDLAILKIEREHRPFLRIATPTETNRGTEVYALGFPGAASVALSESELLRKVEQEERHMLIKQRFRSDEFEYTMTKGIVSRIVFRDETEWIQHNAAINPGNSGGPLITADASAVGINTLGNFDAQGVFYSFTMKQLSQLLSEHGVEVDLGPSD
ncbi:MAG: trypsin-like peptidase domain-containing protein [Planctomycetaceae bacterium]|nr:trypsin-like peptidase domain-containing protein [Planctomycetaceae bacterium]